MKKILLIDDDEDDQFFFMDAIKTINHEYQCDNASNGKTALEKLKIGTSLPDIIFLDLNMPFMNGIEFLLLIKKDETLCKIPIGIFTTSNSLNDKEMTKEFGANFFLSKPTNFHELCEKISQILALNIGAND